MIRRLDEHNIGMGSQQIKSSKGKYIILLNYLQPIRKSCKGLWWG